MSNVSTLPKLEGRRAELLRMAELIAEHSGGRIQLVSHEEDSSATFAHEAGRFLKLDGKRLGYDIEQYGFMGDGPMGWESLLPAILQEVLTPIREEFPQSYAQASEVLRQMGEAVYDKKFHGDWKALFD